MKHVPRIIDAVLKGEVVDDLLYREPGTIRKCGCQEEIPFFKGKKRIILGTNQRIDPIRILDYIREGGYEALLARPLESRVDCREEAIGLRPGRGLPTGERELARSDGDRKEILACKRMLDLGPTWTGGSWKAIRAIPRHDHCRHRHAPPRRHLCRRHPLAITFADRVAAGLWHGLRHILGSGIVRH
jgi:hypothetical protein